MLRSPAVTQRNHVRLPNVSAARERSWQLKSIHELHVLGVHGLQRRGLMGVEWLTTCHETLL